MLDIFYITFSDSDVGVYDLEMKAFLVDYPAVQLIKSWTVEIVPCQITDLIMTDIAPKTYSLY